MHHFLQLTEQAINQRWFKYSVRSLLVFLLISGAWVATRDLDFPDTYSINDKLIHIVVFGGYAVLADLSFKSKSFWLTKGLPLLIYGLCIEFMQYYAPDRTMSLQDWFADFVGILLYFLAMKLFFWFYPSFSRRDNSG